MAPRTPAKAPSKPASTPASKTKTTSATKRLSVKATVQKPASTPKPGKPARRSNKSKAPEPVDDEDSEEEDEDSDEEDVPDAEEDEEAKNKRTAEEKKRDVDWLADDMAKSFALIAAVTDDKVIKNIIYPGPGAHASTKNGGGKKKTLGYRMCHEALFENDPQLKEIYRFDRSRFDLPKKHPDRAEGKKWLTKWNNKIKSRLHAMATETTKNIVAMGKTGAGLASADLITAGSELENVWTVVKEKCPYFYEMRDLIGDRPSVVRTGLGNPDTPIDMDVLETTAGEVDDGEEALQSGEEDAEGEDEEDIVVVTGNDAASAAGAADPASEDATAPAVRKKPFVSALDFEHSDSEDGHPMELEAVQAAELPPRRRKRKADAGEKAASTPDTSAAGANKSAPKNGKKQKSSSTTSNTTSAPRGSDTGRKKSKIDQFAEMAASEQELQLSEINLAKAKADREAARVKGKVENEKIRLEGLAKKEEGKSSLRMERLKLQQLEMQFKIKRMEIMQQQAPSGPFPGGMRGGWYGPQGPSMWGMPPNMYGSSPSYGFNGPAQGFNHGSAQGFNNGTAQGFNNGAAQGFNNGSAQGFAGPSQGFAGGAGPSNGGFGGSGSRDMRNGWEHGDMSIGGGFDEDAEMFNGRGGQQTYGMEGNGMPMPDYYADETWNVSGQGSLYGQDENN
ncbi:unnamed protein product [Peniophora sp. CBMAI 1063]|nr:unnamed protein product [Peniophora sp. CBMAI 1063]